MFIGKAICSSAEFYFWKKTAPVSPSPPPSFLSQFSFFTPPVQTPIRNHLHARKPADVDLAHHQLLLPWEPKQRNLSPACTHRLSHTFLTCLHSKQSRARAAEKASRQRLCPRGCRLSRATCTPTHLASFPSPEAQDRLTRDRVCCPVLRSGHVTHKPSPSTSLHDFLQRRIKEVVAQGFALKRMEK